MRRWAALTWLEKVRSSSRLWTPSPPSRAMSPCSTSTVARASDRARWSGVVDDRNSRASVASLQLGASSRVRTRRARRAVSTESGAGQAMPSRAHPALRKPRSNGALWATSTAPRLNSRNAGSAWSSRGLPATIASVMPVSTAMNGGIAAPGLTSVWNSPRTSPPRTFTAPISVISQDCAEPPVVSRSTTTNVVSRSGLPSSSKVAWTGTASGVDGPGGRGSGGADAEEGAVVRRAWVGR